MPVKPRGERILAQPFADWLDRRFAEYEADPMQQVETSERNSGLLGPSERLAADLGWRGLDTPRVLYRYRNMLGSDDKPTDTFERGVVQDALEHVGVPFEDVYPDLAVDVELGPEAYCKSCHEVVTPIDGVCPWCERAADGRVPERRYCPREDAMRFPAVDGDCWRCGSALKRQSPVADCACGCGARIVRFAVRTGREVKYAIGHAPRSIERKREVPVEPFALWLENELHNLDPIQSLARKTGLSRDTVLLVLNRRVDTIGFERARNAMWRVAREGQGGASTNDRRKGMPSRPGALRIRDIYPEYVRSTRCPDCGGRKSAKAERCRGCNTALGKSSQAGRSSSVTAELVLEARRLRVTERLPWMEIAARIQPRTRCRNVESVKGQLLVEFRERGWPTGRLDRQEQEAA